MNRLETWFCATTFWRNVTRARLLPRMLDGQDLGTHVLELGAGSGAATPELLRRFRSVTSLDSAAFVTQASRAARNGGLPGTHSAEEMHGAVDGGKRAAQLVRGDAAQLPFADESFSCAVAILM